MKVKIKSGPQDFIVEEIAKLPLKKKGAFGSYILQKRGWNTVGLLLELSRKLNIPFKNFSYGGKKDRHALTTQYITIKGPKISSIKAEDYSLKFCGFMDRPFGPDLIEGNKFQVVVRGLSSSQAERALKEIEPVSFFGYPNYFDDQRFGSFDSRQGFLAEKLLKGQFNGALKIYLTSINPQDSKEEKERKRYFFENWKNWKACRDMAATAFEEKAFSHLEKYPNDFLTLLKQIPKERLSIYLSAYQAYIWNEVLRKLIQKETASKVRVYPGIAGDYIFYNQLKKEERAYLENLEIPTLAANLKMPDALSSKIHSGILQENGIMNSMFNKLKVRQAFFKATPRRALVKPESLSFGISDDELYSNKKKISLKFNLPRSSYATMLIKRLFSS